MKALHAEVKARSGSPGVHAELVDRGPERRANLVAKVTREAGIAAETRRTFRQTTDSDHSHPVAENAPDREFDPEEPNAAWVADVTYLPTREGWVYLAVVENLFSRMVVGWAAVGKIPAVRAGLESLRSHPKRVVEEPSRRLNHTPGGSRKEILDRLLSNLEAIKMSQDKVDQILTGS